MKKVLLSLTTATIITFGALSLPIDNVQAENTIEDVNKEQKVVNKKLSKAESKLADLLLEIKDLNEDIEFLATAYEHNSEEIKKTEKAIKELEIEITSIKDKIEERNEILKERLVAYQENGGNIQYLEVIMGAKDPIEFLSRVDAVTSITNADLELIEKNEKDKKIVEEKVEKQTVLKEEYEKEGANIKAQKTEKEEKSQSLKDKQATYEAEKAKLEKASSDLKALENEILASLEPKEPAAKQVASTSTSKSTNEETLEEATSEGTSKSKSTKTETKSTPNIKEDTGSGSLGWPTSGGYISSGTGARFDGNHKGIDIARTDRSTSPPIYAAESGKVVTAGMNSGGYGNWVIIDHGGGLKTLYAHLASLNVSSGQSVSRGEQIGVMGQTGYSTGIHLHFEVHLNGAIQNPLNYLK